MRQCNTVMHIRRIVYGDFGVLGSQLSHQEDITGVDVSKNVPGSWGYVVNNVKIS